jgi:hypothetical protein
MSVDNALEEVDPLFQDCHPNYVLRCVLSEYDQVLLEESKKVRYEHCHILHLSDYAGNLKSHLSRDHYRLVVILAHVGHHTNVFKSNLPRVRPQHPIHPADFSHSCHRSQVPLEKYFLEYTARL